MATHAESLVDWERDNLLNFLVELQNAHPHGGNWSDLAAGVILNWFNEAKEESYAN